MSHDQATHFFDSIRRSRFGAGITGAGPFFLFFFLFFFYPASPSDKLQALVYDTTLLPATAVIDYATGLGKLSASEQFLVGVQTAVSL